jgi:hypothetical protein
VTEQNSPSAASSKPDTPKGARAVCSIAVDAITIPSERLRKLRPEVVDWLVESIYGAKPAGTDHRPAAWRRL